MSRAKAEGRSAFVLAQLEKLLAQSADCRVYARDCGAVETVGSAAEGLGTNAGWSAGAMLGCLRAACLTDSIAEAVAGRRALLARCGGLLAGEDRAAAGAAAKLLQTCSAAEGARPALAAHFSQDPAAVVGLAGLLDLPGAGDAGDGGASGAALALLSNLLTQASMKQALAAGELDYRQLVQRAAGVLLPPVGTSAAAGATAGARETAAGLLGNACGSADVRAHVAALPGFVAGVVGLLPAGGADPRADKVRPKAPTGEAQVSASSVLALLANVMLEGPGRAAFCAAGGPAALLQGVLADPLLPTPVFARAALVLARWAKDPGAAAEAAADGGVGKGGLLGRVLARLHVLLPAAGGAASDFPRGGPADVEAADQGLRFVALCARAGGGAGAAAALRLGAPEVLLRALAASTLPDSAAGNAALALGDLARTADGLGALEALDAVQPLVHVAHRREGASAKRNAAIAIAQLARSPHCLGRIRELRALEVIAAHVKV